MPGLKVLVPPMRLRFVLNVTLHRCKKPVRLEVSAFRTQSLVSEGWVPHSISKEYTQNVITVGGFPTIIVLEKVSEVLFIAEIILLLDFLFFKS